MAKKEDKSTNKKSPPEVDQPLAEKERAAKGEEENTAIEEPQEKEESKETSLPEESVNTSESQKEEPEPENEKETVSESLDDGDQRVEESDAPKEEAQGEQNQDRVTHPTVYGDDPSAITIEKNFSFQRLLFFVGIVCVSAALFFAGMVYVQSSTSIQVPQFDFLSRFIKPSPTPTETPTPTPTPEPEFSLSDFKVHVLNGSGVSGAAGAVSETLEEEGFEDIDVGNADEQDFTDTRVQLKQDVPSDVFEIITNSLNEYTVEEDTLDEDSDYDIIVTVGQKNDEEEE